MAVYRICPPQIYREVHFQIPSSKSISNRLLVLSAIHNQDIPIQNISNADDTSLLNKLLIQIKSHGKSPDICVLNCNNAGTVFRFLTALVATIENEWVVTGSDEMKNRPVAILVDALRQLGAEIRYMEKEGFPPLRIKGKQLRGGKININASISSQYISALLMLASKLQDGLSLQINSPIVSRPYVDMTLELMNQLGIKSRILKNEIHIGPQALVPRPIGVEPDWSSAAFWYSIAVLSGHSGIFLNGFKKHSIQGDAIVSKIFDKLGVDTRFNEQGIQLITKALNDDSFEYDFTPCPDLAQAVAVTCAGLNIPARLFGLKNLRIKETDRLSALESELKNAGYACHVNTHDELIIEKKTALNAPVSVRVKTYNDHRMAMAFASLGALHTGIEIDNPQVVSKSYPGFWEHLKSLGFEVMEIESI